MATKKILIVEDDVSLSRALKDTFTDEGFEVLKAENGEEGLKIALDQSPDLILLDLKMPKMDGMTMLKELRADESGKTIPVIILTNLNDIEKMATGVESGVYAYLIKSEQTLGNIVKEVKEKLKM